MLGFDLDLLNAVIACGSVDDLRAAAERFCDLYGFSIWIYGLAGPDVALTNYPPGVVERYKQQRWHRGYDPLINAVGRVRRALAWDLHRPQPFDKRMDRMERSVMGQRWDVGARSGVTAPIFDRSGAFDYAIVSFSRDQPMSTIEQRRVEPYTQLFAAYLHSVAPSILMPECNATTEVPKLSPRERDCLSWAAKGKSSWEIGQLLSISVATVNFHLANAATKLDARGRTLAIAKAMRLGLISPV
ncbi:MAG TPA: LuxR C-terminal-related transcriptional regulator [Rudaea sp.]|jgi:LuxR family quorum-sensing system transcriptional regulator CciR|nr:LuxR C-terminal-related transcriptional regulator [Rudaea sp.]